MLQLILITLALAVLIIASIHDIRTREVPDWLNYSLFASALAIRLIASILADDFTLLTDGIFGFLLLFAFATFFFYGGHWGGGDSKLLMAMGALIGINIPINLQNPTFLPFIILTIILLPISLIDIRDRFPDKYKRLINTLITVASLVAIILALPLVNLTADLLMFIPNLLIAGGIYAIFWCIGLIILHRKKFMQELKKMLPNKHLKIARYIALALLLLALILVFTTPKSPLPLLIIFLAGAILALQYTFVIVKACELSAMQKTIPAAKLTEGDWIVDDIMHKGRRIAGPSDLGVTNEQIKRLKKLNLKVKIKEGIPFVPSFLFAYLIGIYNPTLLIDIFKSFM